MKKLCTLFLLLTFAFNYAKAEQEPQDNVFKTAEVVALPYNSTGHIATVGDKDIKKVTTATGGMLVIDITNVPANLEMQVFAYGVNDTIVNIGNITGGSAASVKLKVTIPAGTWYILANDQNNNDNNAAAFTMQMTLDVVDAGEWNNTFKTATVIPQNDTFAARLDGVYLPLPIDNDRDYYKFTTTGGLVTIKVTNVPSALEIQLYAYTATDSVNTIGGITGGSGADAVLQLSLPAGTYVFRISDQYDNDLDGTPFTVQINLDKDEACEWNNFFGYACTVPENTTFQARIAGVYLPLPIDNDRDYYKVNTTSGGLFSVSITKVPANLELQISVYLAGDSTKLVGSVTGTQGQPTRLDVVVPKGSYTIRINDQYDNEVSDSLYNVKFSLDLTDGCEWNNFFKAACTVNENSSFKAAIRGYNLLMPIDDDRDYYKVNTTGGGLLTINIPKPPANLEMEIYVYLAGDSTKLVGNITGAQGQPTTLKVVIPLGSYYIRINDQYDNELSDSAYTVNINLKHDDGCEWNNFFAAACTVNENSSFPAGMTGYNYLTNPDNDRDYYKVNTTAGGVLAINVPKVPANLELEIYVYLASDSTKLVGNSTAGSGKAAKLEVVVPQGSYFIRINDQYDNDLNDTLYTVNINLIRSDSCEWNNFFKTACTVGENDTFPAALRGYNYLTNPDNDRDYYKITTSRGGVLVFRTVNVPANLEMQVYAFRAVDTVNAVGSVTGTSGADVSLELVLPAGTYYIRVSDQNDNDLNDTLYSVQIHLDVDDDCEWNNTFATACQRNIPDTFAAKIRGFYWPSNPDNDRDYYKVNSPSCGTLNVSVYNVPPTIQIQIYVFDGNDSTKTLGSITGSVGANTTLTMAVGIKSYYIRINDSNDNNLDPNSFMVALTLSNTNPVKPNITLTGSPALCPGDSVFLISDGANHHWTTGETTVSIIVKTAGTYIDTVYGAPGCYAASSPVTVTAVPTAVANFGFTKSGLTYSFTDSSQGATTYSWDFGDGNTDSSPNPTHTYSATGAYTVTLIVTNKCGSDTIQKVVNLSTGMASASKQAQFNVLPNPCNLCEIKGTVDPGNLVITDLLGRKVTAYYQPTGDGYLLVLPNDDKGLLLVRDIKSGEVRKFVRE